LRAQAGAGDAITPWVFTEYGAVMLASVLRSTIAIQTSILVVRGFIRLREWLVAHEDLAQKLKEREKNTIKISALSSAPYEIS